MSVVSRVTLVAVVMFAASVEAGDLRLLFLGDSGPHQPKVRFDILHSVFADDGIEMTYTENVTSALTTESLGNYDGLILYANIDAIAPENAVALLRYVDNGGGFVPLHCASHCFRNNDDVVRLIGGQFAKHGRGDMTTVSGDASHPIMKGYTTFTSWDETYVHKNHNEAKRKVLEYRRGKPQKTGQKQEPWTWVRNHGAGRVFYTAWGHDERTWNQPGFQNLIERGIRWVCKADPSEAGEPAASNDFVVPQMTALSKDVEPFEYIDVGPKIPNYPPAPKWGVQEAPKTLMQLPLETAESQKHFVTPTELTIELYATEPQLGGKPIAMNWDEQGRLWVCETIDYPNELQPAGKGRDRIRICEDTDGDFVADKFTVFAEGLSIPTAITFWKGGAIVQNGVETLYLKDTNGDGSADFREVLISNWTLGDTHGGVSNLRYGHDNWIWGMQGYNNSEVVINGEKQLPFRMGFFRFQLDDAMPPKVTQLEFIRSTNNNTWGIGFSEEGLVFGSTANRNPSNFMPIPNRYYERVNGWSTDRLAMISDTHLFNPITDKVRQVDHHGGYTAAAGHALYTARNYPQSWWNRTAFVCGPTGHLVGTFVLERDGAGYTSTNPFNLLASDDEWSAPIVAEVGPDGNVWVLDWYNYIVQHNPTPQGFETGKGRAYVSDLRDKKYGRVYRLVSADGTIAEPITLDRTDVNSLVAGLTHSSMTTRLSAQRLLIEEHAVAAIPQLISLVNDTAVDEIGLNVGAIHALQTLKGLGAIGDVESAGYAAARTALSHPSAGVRRNAVAVLPDTFEAAELVRTSGILNDADPQVLLAALLALADLPSADVGRDLIAVATMRGASDRWIHDAVIAAAANNPVSFLRALAITDNKAAATLSPIANVVSEHLVRSGDCFPKVEAVLTQLDTIDPIYVNSILEGFADGWPRELKVTTSPAVDAALIGAFERLPTDGRARLVRLGVSMNSEVLKRKADEISKSLLASVEDVDAAFEGRLSAADSLIALNPASKDTAEGILEVIGSNVAPDLATGLLARVSTMTAALIGQPIADIAARSTPVVREAALEVLLKRPETTRILMDELKAGTITTADLTLVQRQQLSAHPDVRVRRRARGLLAKAGGLVSPNRAKILNDKLPLVQNAGNVTAGKLVFEKHCATCHQYKGVGKKIGPVLDGMAVHPKAELLTHILDPSRSVEGNYRAYTVVTTDGLVVNGMLANESRTSIEIVDTKGVSKSILRQDIDEILPSRKSVMPEGFESNIDDQSLVDLLEYMTDLGGFAPLPLDKYATITSTEGMFFRKDGVGERIVFDDWGAKMFDGVPFLLVDPEGTSRSNMVMLNSPNGAVANTMPKSVTMDVGIAAKKVHLLSGIGGWCSRKPGNNGVSMIVRLNYADGTIEDHKLINGQHFADYNGLFEVPKSKLAFKTNGGRYQVRYLSIAPERNGLIQSMDFVKGDDRTAPIVVAVTVEPR